MTKWSDKRKKAINCDAPKGFSEKAHCAGKKKMATGGLAKPQQSLKDWANKTGEPKVVKNLLKQVSDTFQALRLKVSALLSTLLQLVRSVLAKKPGSNS